MTFNRIVWGVLAVCFTASAAGFAYLWTVRWVEGEIERTAAARWD